MRTPIALLAVVAALVVGIQIGANPDLPVVGALKEIVAPDRAEIPVDQARELIQNEYIRKVSDAKLTDGSIRGMVRALEDPYSHYFDPEQNKAFELAIRGSYSGVGMAVNDDRRGLLVTDVYDGSPAKERGIRPGDVITAVNGRPIAGQPSEASVARIKGPKGSFVTLTVRSAKDARGKRLGAPRTIRVQRREIQIPVTQRRMIERDGRKTGVVELTSFTERAGAAVASELDKLKKQGADAFVLDLRGNGGGRLDQAVEVSSLFVPDGLIVATDGRSRPRREYKAIEDLIVTAKPLVVLVDRGSASASEIVAGALKYRDRALIVGTRTYGKGIFQEVTEFDNGGALSLTVGRYELPGRHFITRKGLEPDLEARDDPRTRRDEALDASLAALAAFRR